MRFNADLFDSDEALVSHIAHEMYELNALRKIFDQNDGAIKAKKLNELIAPRDRGGLKGNLHEQAWDKSDELISRMRRGN